MLLIYADSQLVMTRDVYYNILSDQMEYSRIDQVYEAVKGYSIWGYLFVPLILWLRIAFVVLMTQFPFILRDIDIPFKQVFRAGCFGLLFLAVGSMLRIIYLSSLPSDQVDKTILTFVPFSIAQFLDAEAYGTTAFAVLSSFNIFELLWILMISKGVASSGKVNKGDAILVTSFIWVIILVFQWGLGISLEKING